ncbi:MAG: HAD-IA family hydrolase [Bacteroidia bacterium]|nr:HAD-IA family hydrolase [Bacteroidia bacterium]
MILEVPKVNLDLLEQLSEKYDLYLMSNANPTHINLIDQKLQNAYDVDGIQPYFIKAYFSFDVNMTKPDPAYFQLLIQDNELNVKTTLFIDDALPNIEAAKGLGFHTIHFTEGADNLETAVKYLI